MSIEFTCPNGHRLRVKSELAGKSGHCPQCQARVVIPRTEPMSEDELLAVLGTPRKVAPAVLPNEPPARHHAAGDRPRTDESHAHLSHKTSAEVDANKHEPANRPGSLVHRRRVCPKCCEIVSFAHTSCPHCQTSLSGWSFPLPEESSENEGSRSSCHYLGMRKQGDVMVVRFGEHRILDEVLVKKFGDELFHVADRDDCQNLLLNFTGVVGLSSAMLGIMLMLRKKINQKRGKLKLCVVGPEIMDIFRATKLGQLFEIVGNEQQALKAFA